MRSSAMVNFRLYGKVHFILHQGEWNRLMATFFFQCDQMSFFFFVKKIKFFFLAKFKEKYVAIKFFLPQPENNNEMFKQEVKILKKVKSYKNEAVEQFNIPTLYDFGKYGNIPFIVITLCDVSVEKRAKYNPALIALIITSMIHQIVSDNKFYFIDSIILNKNFNCLYRLML